MILLGTKILFILWGAHGSPQLDRLLNPDLPCGAYFCVIQPAYTTLIPLNMNQPNSESKTVFHL